MPIRSAISLLFTLAISPSAFALDAACEPILKASEARINQPVWHTISETTGIRVEMIKANKQFYRLVAGKWSKFPINIDDMERKFIAQVRSDEVKLSQCKVVGNETIDGMPVTVISSRTELKGAPPAEAKLYIGTLDGLPYRQTGKNVTVTYRYKNVTIPTP